MISYKEYRQKWNEAGEGKLFDFPVHIDIELTNVCNLACHMCPQSNRKIKEDVFMKYHLFKKIIDQCEGKACSIKLNWRGESTLHPEFDKFLEYTQAKFTDVIINTNGMYNILKNKTIAKYCDTVIFSLDSLNPAVLSQLRRGASLDRIKLNIQHLLGRVKIKINYRKQRLNWGEHKSFVKFCNNRAIELDERIIYPRTDYDKNFVYQHLLGVKRKMCTYPFQRLTIAHDAKVYQCCIPWDGECPVGDISSNDTIYNIWHGKEMKEIRKQSKKVQYKHFQCIKCASWNSYEVKWRHEQY